MGWRNVYKGSTKLVLVPFSDSYLLIESISIGVSGPSCPTLLSRSLTVDFILFPLFISILFYFTFPFLFLFLEQLRLGVISHAVTSVTI